MIHLLQEAVAGRERATILAQAWQEGRRLPRLVARPSPVATMASAGGIGLAALVDACVEHLLANHVVFGVPPGPCWVAKAVELLASCPLRGALELVLTLTFVTLLIVWREVCHPQRLRDDLQSRVGPEHRPVLGAVLP